MTQQPVPTNFDGPPSAPPNVNIDTEVGRSVIDSGLATRHELDYCREQMKQASDPNQRSLADLLVENGFVTANQIKRVRRQMEERRSSQIPGYTLINKLGKGAMATVYKARQNSLQRDVAIKVLPKKSSESVEFIERFVKEGRAAARLSHNNIVQAIDVGSTAGQHPLLRDGIYRRPHALRRHAAAARRRRPQLHRRLKRSTSVFRWPTRWATLIQKGLIHRDVKPKNIILTKPQYRQADRPGS